MKKIHFQNTKVFVFTSIMLLVFSVCQLANAQVSLMSEVKVTDEALYFDGTKNTSSTNNDVNTPYDYAYGRPINPHGDCIKTYKEFVFMTWYRGGKEDRHVMLTRYNTITGTMKTIEFPHRHTGFDGKWWIGETHNTIAIGICPRNGTIHMAYDMHAYGNGGAFVDDYFRYSYSVNNAAEVADEEFTLDKFVKDPIDGDYRHCTMNGVRNVGNFSRLSYPKFFLNSDGELFLTMRRGTSHDGGQVFIQYKDAESKWGLFKDVTAMGAKSKGETHDWSIYGNMKFCAGKMRLGFQRRLRNGTDKFIYQNGVYYAYCDDPTGASQWKNYKGEPMTLPLVKAGEVLIMEPGDYVQTTQKDMVHIVDGFDFEVTDRGDEHIVSKVTDKQNNVKKLLHTYRKVGASEFTTEEYSAGSELYAAGNDIYVIGLNGGRVNIVKTEGGTSNFKQIYQHTTGPTFDKGIVYISDGKLYYYLKEIAGTGAKRSTYLQVFDLAIDTMPADTTRTLEFANVANNQEFEQGANLSIEANVGRAFTEVSLWYGTTNLGTLTRAPYSWSQHEALSNVKAGEYTFKLVAKDVDGVEEERGITIRAIALPQADILSNHLIFYYPLDDDAEDISGKKNHATLGGAVTLNDGRYGNGASFAHIEGSYLTTADSVFKYSYPTAYTIAFWLKVTDYSERRDILQPIGGRTLLYSNGDLSFRSYHQKQVTSFSLTNDEKDEWFHVAIIIDQREGQTQQMFYINGEQRGSQPMGYDLETDKSPAIGRMIFGGTSDASLGRNFAGMLDEVCMFDEVLSEDEINFLMNAENLKSYLKTNTAINETNSISSLKIYPIPVSQTLNIQGVDGVRAGIYSLSGSLIKKVSLEHNQVDVSMLKSGMYILQVVDRKGFISTARFVVQ